MLPLLIIGAAVLLGAAAYFVLKNAKKDADCNFGDKPVGNTTQKCPLEENTTKVNTGLGDDVDNTVSKSPVFTKKVNELLDKGWKFKYGEAGKGTYCDRQNKTIVVDENEKGKTNTVVTSIAHEVGHAGYSNTYTPPKGLTKQQYVDANVNDNLADEGEATLTNIEIKRDLAANGGPKIKVAGYHADDYEKIYEKYPDVKDRQKARNEIGAVFADNEHPSTDPSKTYKEYYAKSYEDFYDQQSKSQ